MNNIAVAYGDGIGPEIMDAVLRILKESGAALKIDTIKVGEECYEKGYSNGVPPDSWKIIEANKILLKAPITTPLGKGYKSMNVTLRRYLGLYANIRPSSAYAPFVKTFHPDMDVVIIRENEEGLYAGIEYRQTHNVYQCLKLFSRTGCERIIHYAFEYAVRNNRKKVTCFSKNNIMKMTDGLFANVFDEIATQYPKIEADHMLIDIGTAKLANNPEMFDVIVTSNLYGDIISDVAAEVSGSVGMAGSANIGTEYAMFEAVHGSAPDIAGQNIANPSGLLNAAIMMLVHLGELEIAEKIHNALLKTIEDGIHTGDIYDSGNSKEKVGTKEFADAVIARLGATPNNFEKANYIADGNEKNHDSLKIEDVIVNKKEEKQLVGTDIFLDWVGASPEHLADLINKLVEGQQLKLQLISSRGLKVWPGKMPNVAIGDHWRLRFLPEGEKITTQKYINELISAITEQEYNIIKIENLYLFDNNLGFTLAQGE
ncbi:MAG: NADP-dependent isocitrate dehydrogenase [Pseudomonadota bacterium]